MAKKVKKQAFRYRLQIVWCAADKVWELKVSGKRSPFATDKNKGKLIAWVKEYCDPAVISEVVVHDKHGKITTETF
jgi:hypothetical protein